MRSVPGRVLDELGERGRWLRGLVARAGIRRDDRVEQARAVAHGPGDHALGHHPEHHLAGLRAVGAEAAAGLQADQPVARRRDPHRAAAVVGTGCGHDARGHGRARPTRRAAGRVGEVERVAGGTEQVGLGDPLRPELGGVGLAEDDQPRVEEPACHQGVLTGDVVGQGPRPVGGREPGVLLPEVLDQERHPGVRPGQLRVGSPGVRDLGQRDHDRVDQRVDRVLTLPCQREQVDRRDLLGGHQTGQGRRVRGEVLACVHRRSLGVARPHGWPMSRTARRRRCRCPGFADLGARGFLAAAG